MSPDDSFTQLMDRLRQRDQEAASLVFQRFAGRLLALARDHLAHWAGPQADAEDVVQSAYRSFYHRCAAGQFALSGWQAVWGLLSVIVARKCVNRIEYLRADRRDVQREVPWQLADGSPPGREVPDPEPTPLEAAVLSETIEHWMQALPERDRRILALHLQGYEIPEISARIGRVQRTVRRALERAQERLCRLAEDPAVKKRRDDPGG